MNWTASDVTVVVPTIPGRDALLHRALESVRAQTARASAYVLYDLDRDGAHVTRNRALDYIDTEWICWLDDDDELLPDHVQTMLDGANESGADLIYTYAEFVGDRDPLAVKISETLIPEPVNVPWTADTERSLREFGNFIPVTNMVRVSAMRAVGGFPAPGSFGDYTSGDCEDYGLLLRLLDAGFTFHHVTGVRTWRYHFHGANTGGRGCTTTT